MRQVERVHRGKINSIRPIKTHPFGFVSCGVDKWIKVWSRQGTVVGEINLLRENTKLNSWKFGYDWGKKKHEELTAAKKVIHKIKKMQQRRETGQEKTTTEFDTVETKQTNQSRMSEVYIDPSAYTTNNREVMELEHENAKPPVQKEDKEEEKQIII